MHYSRRNWCCPFFRYDEKCVVHCEDGSVVKLKDRQVFAEYADRFCGNARGWKECQIAASLVRIAEKKEARKEGKKA